MDVGFGCIPLLPPLIVRQESSKYLRMIRGVFSRLEPCTKSSGLLLLFFVVACPKPIKRSPVGISFYLFCSEELLSLLQSLGCLGIGTFVYIEPSQPKPQPYLLRVLP
jgi:hypothetical protein